jgi:FMN phosphatase YigB (HAD superfamily)
VIVFDLGGVLARICHTWEEAASVAGIRHKLAADGTTSLSTFSGFDQYQAGKISLEDYVKDLAEYIGCEESDALAVHNSIIIEEYEGIRELVRELEAVGWRTGCLSNTNAAHWEHLALNGRFPAIASLEMKMASHLAGVNKPDPRVYDLYCEEFGLTPGQIVFFDDLPANVAATNLKGWRAAHIRPGEDTADQIRRHLQDWNSVP